MYRRFRAAGLAFHLDLLLFVNAELRLRGGIRHAEHF